MPFERTKDELLQPYVIHRLPGRIRLGVGAIRWVPELQGKLITSVGELKGVRRVRVSPVTSNLLIHYDPERAAEQEIVDGVAAVFDRLRSYVRRARRDRVAPAGVKERVLQEEPLSRKLLDVVITGATLGFVYFTRGAPSPPLAF